MKSEKELTGKTGENHKKEKNEGTGRD